MNNDENLRKLTITGVHRRRGMQYLLEIDDEEFDMVDKKLFDETEYDVDSQLTFDELKELMNESFYRRAKNKAFYLISLRDHSCKEIKQKLYGMASPDVLDGIIEELCEQNYLDDERYARYKVKSLFEVKKFPARRVMQELRQKGISSGIAEMVVSEFEEEYEDEYGEDAEIQRAYELICRKHKRKMDDFEGRRKVSASLGRFGFSYESVRSAIRLWDENFDDDDEY